MRSNTCLTASGHLIGEKSDPFAAVDSLTGERYRFMIHDGAVYRSRIWQTDDASDEWQHYWDGGEHVAFYDEYARGQHIPEWAEPIESGRALTAHLSEKRGERGSEGALDRLAERLTGQPESRFIMVGMDRGRDLFVLAWGGDRNNEWRDEIEALNNGDVWYMEVQSFDPETGEWEDEDMPCENWFGEDKATQAWENEYPLAEFPAEHVLTEAGA